MAGPGPVGAVLSNKLLVDNNDIRDNTFDVEDENYQAKRSVSGDRIKLSSFFVFINISR
jgi:hypothetical protein